MNTDNREFDLTPMQSYTPPAYPTRGTNPAAALKKLPIRWAKNAAVIACLGALSLGALTGCGAQVTQPAAPAARCDDGIHGVVATYPQGGDWHVENGREFDVEVRTHWGGSGAGPFYVAYLTEQEALGIIRNRLCQAGICFDAPVPDYVATAEVPAEEATAALSLFDERTRQGIVFPAPNWWEKFRFFEISPEQIEGALQQEFAQRFDVSAAFLPNPGESMCDGAWWDRDWETELTFTEEEKQAVGEILKERLVDQVDAFLDHLRTEGVLPT